MSSTSSSSVSVTTGGTATSGTSSSSTTTTFGVPLSITHSPNRIPPATTSPGGGNAGNASTSSSGSGNSFPGSSASNLYLYTFLATLVLLLLVSAGVIMRSISLRIQARRRIEEAIRNGTYVPPVDVNGRRRNAVKPTWFDAHLQNAGLSNGKAGFIEKDLDTLEKGEKMDWEGLQPVAASFIAPPSYVMSSAADQVETSAPQPGFFTRTRTRIARPFRALHIQDIIDEINARDLHTRFTARNTSTTDTEPPAPSQAELAAAAFGTGGNYSMSQQQQQQQQHLESGGNTSTMAGATVTDIEARQPRAVRVAVLIAMPDPGNPTYNGRSNSGRITANSTSATSLPTHIHNSDGAPVASGSASTDDGEAEVPYLEFGVAEVPFLPAHAESGR